MGRQLRSIPFIGCRYRLGILAARFSLRTSLAFHRNFLIFRSVRCHTCVITRCDAQTESKVRFFAKVFEIRLSFVLKTFTYIYCNKKSILLVSISLSFLRFFFSFQSLLNKNFAGDRETYVVKSFLCSFSFCFTIYINISNLHK